MQEPLWTTLTSAIHPCAGMYGQSTVRQVELATGNVAAEQGAGPAGLRGGHHAFWRQVRTLKHLQAAPCAILRGSSACLLLATVRDSSFRCVVVNAVPGLWRTETRVFLMVCIGKWHQSAAAATS